MWQQALYWRSKEVKMRQLPTSTHTPSLRIRNHFIAIIKYLVKLYERNMVENICFTTLKVVLKEETFALSLKEVYWKMRKMFQR